MTAQNRSWQCMFVLLITIPGTHAWGQAKSRKEIIQLGKAATVLVELPRGTGSAFCVHSSGLFVTNNHVVKKTNGKTVRLVLNSGLASQKILDATVIRVNKELDLALLRVNGREAFKSVPLGDDKDLVETTEVTAMGFPFGKNLAVDRKSYPAISVNSARITSLRLKNGALNRIQLDGGLNPGNSGGPVFSKFGEVIGVVVSGILGANLNFAIPVSHVKRFVSQPEIRFTPPVVLFAKRRAQRVFRAEVSHILPPTTPVSLELALQNLGGKLRIYPMKLVKGAFVVSAPPVFRAEAKWIKVSIQYAKGYVEGWIENRTLRFGKHSIKPSDTRLVEVSPTPRLIWNDGKTTAIDTKELPTLNVNFGKTRVTFALEHAQKVTLHKGAVVNQVACTIIARQKAKEVARIVENIRFQGAPKLISRKNIETIPAALDQDKKIIKLPGAVEDVAVAGGGRFLLLHMPAIRKVGLFDVSRLQIAHMFPLGESAARISGGMTEMIVVLPASNLIQRWDITTHERVMTKPIPIEGAVLEMSMGCASQGPVGVIYSRDGSSAGVAFIDVQTLSQIKLTFKQQGYGSSPVSSIRASADGRIFTSWRRRGSQGMETFVFDSNSKPKYFFSYESAGHVLPGKTGSVLYTSRGKFTEQAKAIGKAGRLGGDYHIVAVNSPYYMKLKHLPSIRRDDPLRGEVRFFMRGRDEPLWTTTKIDLPEPTDRMGSRDAFGADKRFHFIPDANVVITIPKTNDRLIAHRLDIMEVMEEAGVDYLIVDSLPVKTVSAGSNYRYRLRVRSRKGDVKYKLETRPEGMRVSPDGLIQWQVPRNASKNNESVVVAVRDASGQEVFHSFNIQIITEGK